jgi:alpha-tubulin suppressor-like RCC1 family protein/cation transport regulator ChaC
MLPGHSRRKHIGLVIAFFLGLTPTPAIGWIPSWHQAPSSSASAHHWHRRNNAMTSTSQAESGPLWCPEQQIYIGGVVPDNSEIDSLLTENDGALRIFGYGSLCWSPGDGALAKEGVTKMLGRAIGYQRCWAQKSADHRGTPAFPGIVCTLLSDDEVHSIQAMRGDSHERNDLPSMTEGVVYTIPADQVDNCLAELDFREKGGYARDVIDVIEYKTEQTVRALLYRGTPDNPAFWRRALLDLPFAAATMAVSIGPSGKNSDYLFQLDEFMRDPEVSQHSSLQDHVGDTHTSQLATMAKEFQSQDLYFLFGSGSNQHNQLLLLSDQNNAGLVSGEDAHELKEMLLCTKRIDGDQVKQLFAGGGHSGLLTETGCLYLWGWNEQNQLGTSGRDENTDAPVPVIQPLHDIKVEQVALGFSHSLVIEKDTGKLFAFGNNIRGQVLGFSSTASILRPTTPEFLSNEKIVAISAGLFHSAVITSEGDLLTFGCARFGQSKQGNLGAIFGKWRPDDGSRMVQVACGRRHTVVLDEHGRVWTVGENKHGQLGRSRANKLDGSPRLVEGSLGSPESGCIAIACGWSHTVATVRKPDAYTEIYGWGRNDKGQLGTGSTEQIATPRRLFESLDRIKSVCCGSESTMILDNSGKIRSCGWNEHGNLSLGNESDVRDPTIVVGARIVAPPPSNGEGKILMAAGGAYFIAMQVPTVNL